MPEYDDDLPIQGTVGERLVLHGERMRDLNRRFGLMEKAFEDLKDTFREIRITISAYAELKPDVLLIIQQAYENEEADKRELRKVLRTSGITLVCTVGALVAEWYLTHGHH